MIRFLLCALCLSFSCVSFADPESQYRQDVERDYQIQVRKAAAAEAKLEAEQERAMKIEMAARYTALLRKAGISQGEITATQKKGCERTAIDQPRPDDPTRAMFTVNASICTQFIQTRTQTCAVYLITAENNYKPDKIDCRKP